MGLTVISHEAFLLLQFYNWHELHTHICVLNVLLDGNTRRSRQHQVTSWDILYLRTVDCVKWNDCSPFHWHWFAHEKYHNMTHIFRSWLDTSAQKFEAFGTAKGRVAQWYCVSRVRNGLFNWHEIGTSSKWMGYTHTRKILATMSIWQMRVDATEVRVKMGNGRCADV